MIMKRLFIAGLVITSLFFLGACDDDGGSDDDNEVNDATSIGDSLTFSGTIDRTFTVATFSWATSADSYTNDFILNDESDDTVYATQDNTGGTTDIDMTYSGTTHEAHLYSTSGLDGITTSDDSVQITTVQIEVDNTWDEVAYCGPFDTELQWYYYLYATGEVILDGTYEDDGKYHDYDNIRFFEGWNQIIKATSDGINFDYTAGTFSDDDGHWCYMDVPEP